ncbi:MAG TPA: dihydrolipoyl dehydrogenase [Limnochordia bacterium]|nr:dihydrolipoyl dehydrogenase [Limnochordia bacterium]
MAEQSAQVVVLGAGPGGYAAAFAAADQGLNVTLVDRDANPGGVCLYRGCIPSKALLGVAALLHEAAHAGEWGVHFEPPQIDLETLRAWKQRVVDQLTGGLGTLSRQRKITYVRGSGVLEGPRTLAVEGEAGRERIRFEHLILATGSRPTVIPGFPTDSPRVWDSTGALALESVPERLLVVGGGYIGAELATVYAALGSRVSIVEMTPGLLPGADRDLVRPMQKRLAPQLEALLLGTKVAEMVDEGERVRVRFEGEGIAEPEQRFDRVLVAVGRRPNSEGLGLEAAGVAVERGFVKVDAQRRTTQPHIFAIGDLASQPMLAHKAAHEGRVAAEVIAGKNAAFAPNAIPAVVFTDPEIAWVGLTENEAKTQGREVQISRFAWAASGRAVTKARTEGLTKLIVDPESGRLLGAGIAGPGAGEMIAEATLAIEMGAVAEDLALTIHAHPTLSETLMEAAEGVFGQSTHAHKPPRPAGRR